MDLADRVVGSALGLALGDALEAPFEFLRARNIPDPIPALERPWLSEPPGSTTDDTAMARNLMRSLSARGRLDLTDLLERHLEWFRSDPPDVGTLTGRVLRRIAAGEEAATAGQAIWNERGAGRSCPRAAAGPAPGTGSRALDPDARRRPLPDRGHRGHARRRRARPRRARSRRRPGRALRRRGARGG